MTLDIRVLELDLKSGVYNTAIDSVLQNEVSTGQSPATILFTRWEPTVSLGITQNSDLDVDLAACDKYGVQIVRRKSGGQSVYLDDEYIVYSVIAPRDKFPADLTHLRQKFCESIADALNRHNVKAQYYQPDNVIIYSGENNSEIRQIGNSGQIINNKAVVVHGSIRYGRKNLPTMTDVLKINGHKLVAYEEQIKKALASVDEYSSVPKSKITAELSKSFASYLSGNLVRGSLTQQEEFALRNPQDYINDVRNEPSFTAKGVCYLFMNGKNLVPELSYMLPYNKPSTVADSTHQCL